MTAISQTARPADRSPLPAGTLPALAGGFAAVAAAALAFAVVTPAGPLAVITAVSVYAGIAAVLLAALRRGTSLPAFGLPNTITLARAGATALVAGHAAEVAVGMAASDGLATFVALLAGAAILADGLDGWAARRRGPETAFGARFDMETDALLILLLSALAVALGKAGVWAVAIGAMRYGFVAAMAVWPWLGAPLPPSTRRKAVCVLQGAILTLLLLPAIGPPVSVLLTATALAALAWSFAVDVIWLARRRPG